MARPRFADQLTDLKLELDQILLDPNNPRLIGIDGYAGVNEERISETAVQDRTLQRLNDQPGLDQDLLRSSIEKSGLLQVDRVVVRPVGKQDVKQRDLYVLVEGNRRIAACKTLLKQHEHAEKNLDADTLSSIEKPVVLVMPETDAASARQDQWLVQGIRHISGIRPWGAYQAAKAIEAMLEKLGYSEADAAGALSITVARVRRSMNVLAVLKQMAESEDFGSFAGPDMYGYFDEVIKRPSVRKWLGWNLQQKVFEEEERLNEFYTWITPDDDIGKPRIPTAEGVRKLDKILQDSSALAELNTPGKTIDDAYLIVIVDQGPDWIEPLKKAIKALDAIPAGDLESMSEENSQLIQDLIEKAKKRSDLVNSLRSQ